MNSERNTQLHRQIFDASVGIAGLLIIFTCATAARAQAFEPAAEDMALIEPLLMDRLDITPETIIHVAPPGGSDGDGSSANPRRDLIAVIKEATAGVAIHLAPGLYDMSAIRDQFGHDDSTLWTGNNGESGRPIVLRTDPQLYDPTTGAIAIIDFNYENDPPSWRRSAFILRHDYWVFEKFEMRRMANRGFWVNNGAYNNTFHKLDLHHADTPGTNNDGLILMAASGGETNNILLKNHLHHVGEIDTSTDTITAISGVNSGCFYNETRLTYDSGEPSGGHDATLAEWENEILPADSHVYFVGNEVHDCHYGLGTKTASRGPYFFLSNHIYDTDVAIFATFTKHLIRNNILRGSGINIGRAHSNSAKATFLKMTGNGFDTEISYNTIIGGKMSFIGGWSTRVHNNLVVGGGAPVRITRNQFAWWENGDWPGIRGEFLIGDLDSSHPFFSLMPGYMQELSGVYKRMRLEDNCYEDIPAIPAADFTQSISDVTGEIYDERYTILTSSEIAALFIDEVSGDYRRVEDDGFDCGSQIGSSSPIVESDGGPSDGGDSTVLDMDGGIPEDTSGLVEGGCGCSSSTTLPSAGFWLLLMVVLLGLNRRRRVVASAAP